MWWSRLTGKLERAEALDPVTSAVEGAVNTVLPHGAVKDALHGVWLGHSLHPLLVALPIGMWCGALLLDRSADSRDAARTLVGAGVLAVLPTAATGLADWSELGLFERPKRVGLVHAMANTVTTALYAGSWLARRRGDHSNGARLALAGAGTMMVGGYLGGHLAYSQGVGVNRNADDSPSPATWTDVADETELGEADMFRADVEGQSVMVTRRGRHLYAIGARCSHYGGPLDEGRVVGDEPCVVCPWHGSEFSLVDGSVRRGPATAPQLSYEARVRAGRIQVRSR